MCLREKVVNDGNSILIKYPGGIGYPVLFMLKESFVRVTVVGSSMSIFGLPKAWAAYWL